MLLCLSHMHIVAIGRVLMLCYTFFIFTFLPWYISFTGNIFVAYDWPIGRQTDHPPTNQPANQPTNQAFNQTNTNMLVHRKVTFLKSVYLRVTVREAISYIHVCLKKYMLNILKMYVQGDQDNLCFFPRFCYYFTTSPSHALLYRN